MVLLRGEGVRLPGIVERVSRIVNGAACAPEASGVGYAEGVLERGFSIHELRRCWCWAEGPAAAAADAAAVVVRRVLAAQVDLLLQRLVVRVRLLHVRFLNQPLHERGVRFLRGLSHKAGHHHIALHVDVLAQP